MTIEEAYAEPVGRKRRRDRAFAIGLLVGLLAGAIAVVLLNRAAEDDPMLDDEPVVELQPAIVPLAEQPTGSIPAPAANA